MKKLYLSSHGIPDAQIFVDFVGKEAVQIKFALILNAKDYKSVDERRVKLEELTDYFSGVGFQVEEVNLLTFKNQEELEKKLKTFDVLWFNGGNTYYLRWAVAKSGMDKILENLLDTGIVYGGDSAGTILVGPTLKYYDRADDPGEVQEIIYDGLRFIDIAILPHWGSGEYDHVLGGIEDDLKKDGFKTMRLRDDEYLLVEDGKIVNR